MSMLDPRVTVGIVSLSVADMARSLAYYQERIGLTLRAQSGETAELGAGGTTLLKLYAQPGARRVQRVAGLYHFALLLPSRPALARMIRQLIETQTPVTGVADHLVSEALYLSDPDGHGIELYADRPRAQWVDENGMMLLDTLPLNVDDILKELVTDGAPWAGIDPGTVMGHVHLHVSHLQPATDFYVKLIGFEQPPTTLAIPTANFIGAGGYHHHLGLNTWAGVGAPPPPADAARLLQYEILFPDAAALEPVLARLAAAEVSVTQAESGWLVSDPSGHEVLLRVAPA